MSRNDTPYGVANMKTSATISARDGLQVPKRLQPGSTIGVAAPAGPFDRERFSDGLKVLETAGFQIYAPADLFKSQRHLAGSDQHRAETVNRLFADPDIDAIICARGGFGSMRILPHLDFGLIGANPKVFIGFSDASVLLNILYSRCRMVTFHGPVVTTLAGDQRKTVDALLHAVTQTDPLTVTAADGLTIQTGKTTAAVCGGNLATLCHLIGTPFEPQYRDHILFLEDCNEAAYSIDRMISQMRLAGNLDGIAGLILGTFEGCGPLEEILAIVGDSGIPSSVPILAGFEAGHGAVNTTLPLGVPACLDANARTLTYQQVATCD